MLTDETRKEILQSFLETIESISNKEYQVRAWIRGEPPGTDFDETVNYFFINGDGILENHNDFKISESQYQILKKFYDRFSTFSDNNSWPPLFIDIPNVIQKLVLAALAS
jgi:hypothetical protein